MLPVFSFLGLDGVLGLFGELREQMEYWRNYRGERIRIEHVSHQTAGNSGRTKEIVYSVEGTVEKVMSFPPGFLLSDVEEYASEEKANDTRYGGTRRETRGRSYRYEEKFVAFRDIDQIVFLEAENEGTEEV